MTEKIVDLRFDGSLEQGFRVSCLIKRQFGRSRESNLQDIVGSLPANQQLIELVTSWTDCYQKVSLENSRAIEIHHVFVGDDNRQALMRVLDEVSKIFVECFHNWLQSPDFQEIITGIYTHLSIEDSLCRILIRSNDDRLQELPWQSWKLLDQYKNTEVAFGGFQSQKLWIDQMQTVAQSPVKNAVEILAIFGNSSGIDLSVDRDVLRNLPKANVTFLESKPESPLTCQKVLTAIQESNCDILFFAGHSRSFKNENIDGKISDIEARSNGLFYINDSTEHITADQLWIALRQAVKSGLKLAIFNSCDGLGISRQLNDNYIPQVIVMRELVPDRVAQLFLRRFLLDYTSGQPLYLAVRSARDSLQLLEAAKDDLTGVQFPHASWLPVIFQNAVDDPPCYPDDFISDALINPINNFKTSLEYPVAGSMIAATVATAGILLSRFLGVWMPIEQGTYDWFLRNSQAILPPSAGDSRIIQIGLEREDLPRYGDRLNDVDLIKLLERLNKAGAIAIGVLLDRSEPIVLGRVITKNSQSSQLTPFENYLKRHPNTIATCQYPERNDHGWVSGAVGPRVDQPLNQLGYQNIFSDYGGTVRRYLLTRGRDVGYSTDRCSQDASYAFGMQLASQFLKFHKIKIESFSEWDLKIASPATKQSPLIIKRLHDFSGFYQDYKTPNSGWQVPLNYRYLGVGAAITVINSL